MSRDNLRGPAGHEDTHPLLRGVCIVTKGNSIQPEHNIMTTIRYSQARDVTLRRRFISPQAMLHPAKLSPQWLLALVERWTLESETILDPMAGSGTTALACLLGRNVILVEREGAEVSWGGVESIRASVAKMRLHGPMAGHSLGEVTVLQGDARHLPEVLADCVITSPPYEEAHQGSPDPHPPRQLGVGGRMQRYDLVVTSPPYESILANKSSGIDAAKYEAVVRLRLTTAGRGAQGGLGSYDAVITSPPYEDSQVAQSSDGEANRKAREGRRAGRKGDLIRNLGLPKGYAAVVTSPPYERGLGHGSRQSPDRPIAADRGIHDGSPSYDMGTHGEGDNIGNLKGAAYWKDGVEPVYRNCHAVLRPGGLMICVVADFVRDRQVVPLVEQTRELLEAIGFLYVTREVRTRDGKSFWRILAETDKVVETVGQQGALEGPPQAIQRVRRVRNGSPSIDTETALILRKDGL